VSERKRGEGGHTIVVICLSIFLVVVPIVIIVFFAYRRGSLSALGSSFQGGENILIFFVGRLSIAGRFFGLG